MIQFNKRYAERGNMKSSKVEPLETILSVDKKEIRKQIKDNPNSALESLYNKACDLLGVVPNGNTISGKEKLRIEISESITLEDLKHALDKAEKYGLDHKDIEKYIPAHLSNK